MFRNGGGGVEVDRQGVHNISAFTGGGPTGGGQAGRPQHQHLHRRRTYWRWTGRASTTSAPSQEEDLLEVDRQGVHNISTFTGGGPTGGGQAGRPQHQHHHRRTYWRWTGRASTTSAPSQEEDLLEVDRQGVHNISTFTGGGPTGGGQAGRPQHQHLHRRRTYWRWTGRASTTSTPSQEEDLLEVDRQGVHNINTITGGPTGGGQAGHPQHQHLHRRRTYWRWTGNLVGTRTDGVFPACFLLTTGGADT